MMTGQGESVWEVSQIYGQSMTKEYGNTKKIVVWPKVMAKVWPKIMAGQGRTVSFNFAKLWQINVKSMTTARA